MEWIEDKPYLLTITCAGMPKACYSSVTWENFEVNSSFSGKKKPKRVKGGIVLADDDFTIKARKGLTKKGKNGKIN